MPHNKDHIWLERIANALAAFFVIAFWFWVFSACAHGAELDLGINYLSGQHQTRSLNLGLKVPFYNDTALFSSKVAYGSHNKEIVQNRGDLRLNYDPTINEKWSLWFYEQIGYDKPKKIDFESFTGGGPKYILYETDRSKSSVSVGYLYHYQEDSKASRLSLRLKGKTKIEPFEMFALAFYQPNIEDFDDYIIIGEAGLKYHLSKALSLKWTVEDNYRSVSPVEKNELLMRLSLGVQF